LIVNRISSIAIPAIGCGEGGLDWALVKPQILLLLQDIECQVFLYEPKGY
jgi:O-acetyl-ADP-ribose deacetylase (regulator of RNase III)